MTKQEYFTKRYPKYPSFLHSLYEEVSKREDFDMEMIHQELKAKRDSFETFSPMFQFYWSAMTYMQDAIDRFSDDD